MQQPGKPSNDSPSSKSGQWRRNGSVARALTLLAGLTLVLSSCSTLTPDDSRLSTAAVCGTTNLAQGKPATASSSENAGFLGAKFAVDGDATTRWASAASDPQWLQVDLGSVQGSARGGRITKADVLAAKGNGGGTASAPTTTTPNSKAATGRRTTGASTRRLMPPRPIRRFRRHRPGTRGRSTQRPSLTSSAGSTVIEPRTAIATTRIAPVASELKVTSPTT